MPLLSRKTAPLLATIKGELNPRLNQEYSPQQYSQRTTPPRSVVSPAHTDDSPLSSADETPVETQNLAVSTKLLSDDDLPSSSPLPDATKPQLTKRTRNNIRKSSGVVVLRNAGKRVEHHRDCSEGDVQSNGNQKRKRGQSRDPPSANEMKREHSPMFGDGVESSQKIRKTYGGSQSRGPLSSGNIHAGVYTKKGFKQPPMIDIDESTTAMSHTKQDKGAPNLKSFRAPPSIPLVRKAKASFKKPCNIDYGNIDLTFGSPSSSLVPTNSSPDQPQINAVSFSISDDSGSPLSSVPQSSPEPSFDSAGAKCPMCKAPVDREFLESFSNGRRMLNREALRFCEAHQQRSAQSIWNASEYPDIDWESLDSRLSNLHSVIDGIVRKQRTSVYRRELERKLATKTGRRFLMNQEASDLQNSIPGYYGRKGAQQMMDYVMRVFGSKLRKESTKDAIFKEVGVSGFVQTVLIPEIACCLVMEDMDVGEERAKEILKESAGMGELVNAEVEEVVVPVDGDDDDGDGIVVVAAEELEEVDDLSSQGLSDGGGLSEDDEASVSGEGDGDGTRIRLGKERDVVEIV